MGGSLHQTKPVSDCYHVTGTAEALTDILLRNTVNLTPDTFLEGHEGLVSRSRMGITGVVTRLIRGISR